MFSLPACIPSLPVPCHQSRAKQQSSGMQCRFTSDKGKFLVIAACGACIFSDHSSRFFFHRTAEGSIMLDGLGCI